MAADETKGEDLLLHLRMEEQRVAQMIASAGGKAPRHWLRRLDQIRRRISQIESRMKGGDSADPFEVAAAEAREVTAWIDELRGDIVAFGKRRLILTAALLVLVALVVFYQFLTSRTRHAHLGEKPQAHVNITYPFLGGGSSEFEIKFCAHCGSSEVTSIDLLIIPESEEFTMTGGESWHHTFDLSNSPRADWLATIRCTSGGPWWKVIRTRHMQIASGLGRQNGRELVSISFPAVEFVPHLVALIVSICCAAWATARGRLIFMVFNAYKARVAPEHSRLTEQVAVKDTPISDSEGKRVHR